jgi:hypothetical protein
MAAASTLGAVAPPVDLVATLTALQVHVATVEAQQARSVAVALELQLADVLGVTTPRPPHPVTATTPVSAASPTPPAAPGSTTPTAGAFEASFVGYLHAHATGI